MIRAATIGDAWTNSATWRGRALQLTACAAAIALGISISYAKWIYALAIVFIPIVLIWPVPAALGAFLFLVPFEPVSNIGAGDDRRALTTLVGMAATCVLFGIGLAGRRLHWPPRAALWWTLFAGWAAATLVWAVDPEMALKGVPTAVSVFMLYIAATSLRFTRQELRRVLCIAILGGCVAALLTSYQFYNGKLYGGVHGERASLSLGSDEANPNDLGANLLMPFSLAIGFFISARTRSGQSAMAAALIAMGFAMLLTMSREVFLGIVTIITIYFYRFRLKKFFLLFFLLIPILLAAPSLFFQRLTIAIKTGGAGRLDIWRAGFEAVKHYGVWGAGINNFPAVYPEFAGYAPRFAGYTRGAHNIYLEIAVEFGILGLVFFISAITSQLRSVLRFKAIGLEARAWLVACEAGCWGLLVCAFFGNYVWRRSFWVAWAMLAAVLRLLQADQGHTDVREETLGPAENFAELSSDLCSPHSYADPPRAPIS